MFQIEISRSFLPASLHRPGCLFHFPPPLLPYEQPFEQCAALCPEIRLNAVSGIDDAAIGDSPVFECSLSLGSCSLQYFIQATNAPDSVFIVSNPQSMLPVACHYVTSVQLCLLYVVCHNLSNSLASKCKTKSVLRIRNTLTVETHYLL